MHPATAAGDRWVKGCFSHFSVYGLCIQADISVPGLLPAPLGLPPDLQVWFKKPSPRIVQLNALPQAQSYVSPDRSSSGQPILRVWTLGQSEGFRFRYADDIAFVSDSAGTEIGVTWPAGMTLDDAVTYLVGPILSFVLRLRGATCLHASAVAVEGRAVAFMGPPSSGKSTLAATFARKGFAVLTDDVVALVERDAGYWVQPGYPRVNLWADSAEALLGSPDFLPLITPGWDKRFLELGSGLGQFQSSPLALGAVYLLDRSVDALPEPRIESLVGREALIALVANTSVNYMLDRSMRSREFELAGRLIASVPVRSLFSSRLDDLDSLVAVILTDWGALATVSRK
jgi:hypothetical protein